MANHPTKEKCYRLLEEHEVPKNIVEHSEQVAKIAVCNLKTYVRVKVKQQNNSSHCHEANAKSHKIIMIKELQL